MTTLKNVLEPRMQATVAYDILLGPPFDVDNDTKPCEGAFLGKLLGHHYVRCGVCWQYAVKSGQTGAVAHLGVIKRY